MPIIAATDFKTLQLEDDTFIKKSLHKEIADLLFSAKINNRLGYFYFLIEHQSTVQKDMPMRLMKYVFSVIEMHQKKFPNEKYPTIYPIIFYTGSKKYKSPTDFPSLFADIEHAKSLLTEPILVVNASATTAKQVDQYNRSGMMEFLMGNIRRRDLMLQLKQFSHILTALDKQGLGDYVSALYAYTINTAHNFNEDDMKDFFISCVSPKTGETIMTIADQIHQRGVKEGITKGKFQGIAEGMKKGKLQGTTETAKQIAEKMQKKGMSEDLIKEITGLELPN